MTDPIDEFLDRDFSCDPDNTLKNDLRVRTTRVLRGRRRLRWLALAGMAAACYLAGMATMWLSVPRPSGENHVKSGSLVIAPKANDAQPEEKVPERHELHEIQALAKAAEYRKAGDFYLEQAHDYDSAVRCYTQAFAGAGPEAFVYSPEDSWLVMAIKNAHRAENRQFSPDDPWIDRAIEKAKGKDKLYDY